jgi:hypothetical protein
MDKKNVRLSAWRAGWLGLALALCAVLLFIGGTGTSAQVGAAKASASVLSPDVTCPAGQCFTDVPPANGFYTNVNNLYMDGIIGGYPCGGTGEPCDADNRPYYRPANLVSRQQMSKFVDLGRRNIAEAVGVSLDLTGYLTVLSTSSFRAIEGSTTSNGEAVHGTCLTPSTPCYGVEGEGTNVGNYGGVFYGGYEGVYASQQDDNGIGVAARSSGASAYAADVSSAAYRSLHVDESSSYYAMYVDTDLLAADFEGDVDIFGALTVSGGCTGCLSTGIVQNVDGTPLQLGDVVTIVGTSPALQGDQPVITVRKASAAYDKGVAGIVGQVLAVPDEATRAAYKTQEQARREAQALTKQLQQQAIATGTKADLSQVHFPASSITDAQGTSLAVGSYGGVVTTGSYKAVKVDASFGPIKAGDLLTSSSNPGYAMKAADANAASGAIIGKALGNLDSGTGMVPVLVTLK